MGDEEIMNSIESCTNTCVGILVQRDNRMLLIERANPPYGWAPPAGHVDFGEIHIQAAARELFEEVGLAADSLTRRMGKMYRNQCCRPGGNYHYWVIFSAESGDEPLCSQTETNGMCWADQTELDKLTQLTTEYLTGNAGPAEWQRNPGLEPVWMTIFADLGLDLNTDTEV